MDFVTVVDQAIALLRQRGRVAYRTLQPAAGQDMRSPTLPHGRREA